MSLSILDILFIYCLVSVWILLFYNIILCYQGYLYYNEVNKESNSILKDMRDWPFVSIMIPAHNEEKVIEKTVLAMKKLDYPDENYEIMVINDNSSDRTGEILKGLKEKVSNLVIITTKPPEGGKGKSGALNAGLKHVKGEFIVVYDADNTPERSALKYLVAAILKDSSLGAVIGKFRTRNKNVNILTKFINIETLSFQWMAQAGRWKLFKVATIPGTNFIIRKSILDQLGGWDEKAVAEDTELSIRIYESGYRIRFFPLAVTWEQEPEKWRVWLKQRTRWVRGNIYVIKKYFSLIFKLKKGIISFDILYFFSTYFLFLSSVIISDIIFILGMLDIARISLTGPFSVLWILAYLLFILEVSIALSLERGENTLKNVLYVALMYFTYCQAWIVLVIRSFYINTKDWITGKKITWYKTERF
ncbi:MAG: glycosyltransferase [Clostridia bacterium]|nr:glycosyltransferase [Clostridia bacterium]